MAGITHEWNGTVLTITSDSGSSSCDLKGATGDTGIRGPQGPKGEKGSAIDSVNGKIGDVVLTYEDVGALPDTYIPPVTKVNSKTGEVTLTYEDVGALPNTYVAPVTSVNTKTGAVQLTYSDVGAAATNHTHTAADVGALTSGGTAADSSKLGGKAPEYYIQPRNLLDNSDFRNPVNQRGQSSYDGMVYGIDRWKGCVVYQTVSVRTTDITITATGTAYSGIIQKVENMSKLAGKTITFAARVWSNVVPNIRITDASENTLASVDGTAQTTQTLIFTYTVPSDATADSVIPVILLRTTASGDYMRIYWAAMYEGSYTADTLPPYVPKGYAAELAECQRYFQVYNNIYHSEGMGYAYSSSVCRFIIPTPQTLRIDPSIESVQGDTTSYNIKVQLGGNSITPTSVSAKSSKNRILLTIGGNFTEGAVGVLRLESNLKFSADL